MYQRQSGPDRDERGINVQWFSVGEFNLVDPEASREMPL
jgi:hypothetical protein